VIGGGQRATTWATPLFLLLVALLAPLGVLGRFQTLEFAYVWSFAIAIVGLNLLTGYCGQLSLGNSAFMAIGGYTTAILAIRQGWSPLATIPIAAVLSTIGGILLGIPALKLRGLYLGLATFALALSVPSVIRHFDSLTGGSQGIYITGAARDPFGLVEAGQLTAEQWLYYLSLGILVLLFLFTRGLLGSDVGRAFRSIRDGETVAVANGVRLAYYKSLAFAISALFAGVAGSLDAMATSYVGPDSFDVTIALALLVGAAIGGLGTRAGPIVGALFTVWSPIYAQQVFKGRPDIVFGALLILIMYVMPQGAVGGFYRLVALRTRLRDRSTAAPEAATATTLGPATVGAEDERRPG
jgi:branched-chain amino acid transport system permease protein